MKKECLVQDPGTNVDVVVRVYKRKCSRGLMRKSTFAT